MDGLAANRKQMMMQSIRDHRREGIRRAALTPYLDRLRSMWPVGITESNLPLEPCERSALQVAYGDGVGPRRRGEALMLEGVALRSKLQEELERFDAAVVAEVEGDTPSGLHEFIEPLVTGASLGLVLIGDAQREIEQSIFSGDMRAAKQVTAIRGKIRETINRVAERLGPVAYRRAREMSVAMLADSDA